MAKTNSLDNLLLLVEENLTNPKAKFERGSYLHLELPHKYMLLIGGEPESDYLDGLSDEDYHEFFKNNLLQLIKSRRDIIERLYKTKSVPDLYRTLSEVSTWLESRSMEARFYSRGFFLRTIVHGLLYSRYLNS